MAWPRIPRQRHQIPCPQCGTVMEITHWRFTHTKVITCSRTCMAAYYRTLRGESSAAWRGGKSISANGYVILRPGGRGHPTVYEHRIVMAAHLGRPLQRHEVIHHRNGDKTDNRIDNLELCSSQAEHVQKEQTQRREQRICLFCDQPATNGALCETHFTISAQLSTHRKKAPRCLACDKPALARELCRKHYRIARKAGML